MTLVFTTFYDYRKQLSHRTQFLKQQGLILYQTVHFKVGVTEILVTRKGLEFTYTKIMFKIRQFTYLRYF